MSKIPNKTYRLENEYHEFLELEVIFMKKILNVKGYCSQSFILQTDVRKNKYYDEKLKEYLENIIQCYPDGLTISFEKTEFIDSKIFSLIKHILTEKKQKLSNFTIKIPSNWDTMINVVKSKLKGLYTGDIISIDDRIK